MVKRRRLRSVGIIALLIILGLSVFINYKTYEPMAEALEAMKLPNVTVEGNAIIFNPPSEVIASLVFYQGGLVKTQAYAVLGQELSERGVRVFMPKMPLNLAILNTGAFEKLYQKYHQGEEKWYIGGHSLGGASASIYVANHPEHVKGIILLGAYPSDKSDLSELAITALSVQATNDWIVNREKYDETKVLLPASTVYYEVEGGNHSNYGYYGLQQGDGSSIITREEQHSRVADQIMRMINSR